jgi:MoaA/NifB/PqqE/SkfB family radical SAM enzyme
MIENRLKLADAVPLETPYSVKVDPIAVCNFRCTYCHIASHGFKGGQLSLETFSQFVNGYHFPQKLKSILFIGRGEPLLNKHLPQMVVQSRQITDKTVLVSNGSLLNKECADALIETEINEVRFSLQGLNAEDYKSTAGITIDFDDFLERLVYFYRNRKNTQIIMKIPDAMLNTPEKKILYETLFRDKCDILTTENIIPLHITDTYEFHQNQKSVFGDKVIQNIMICPRPFYQAYLSTDGSVFACPSDDQPPDLRMGNVSETPFSEIWNSKKYCEFRRQMCLNGWQNTETCRNCGIPSYYCHHSDNIDSERERLAQFYKTAHSKPKVVKQTVVGQVFK